MSPTTVTAHDGWAHVELARPQRRNAIDVALAEALYDAVDRLDGDDTVRAIVLSGSSGAFCSGLDLDVLSTRADELTAALGRLHARLATLATPLIGAVERFAINAGMALALACDLLVAADDAWFQIGEVHLGMGMPMNAAWLRVRSTEAVAMRLALIGDRVPATELHRLGLVAQLVTPGESVDLACGLAAQLAACPPAGPTRVKADIVATRAPVSSWWPPAGPR